jgi:hypothetical protein
LLATLFIINWQVSLWIQCYGGLLITDLKMWINFV